MVSSKPIAYGQAALGWLSACFSSVSDVSKKSKVEMPLFYHDRGRQGRVRVCCKGSPNEPPAAATPVLKPKSQGLQGTPYNKTGRDLGPRTDHSTRPLSNSQYGVLVLLTAATLRFAVTPYTHELETTLTASAPKSQCSPLHRLNSKFQLLHFLISKSIFSSAST
ncbi:hypothetical protein EDD36DRAFT_193205 [Exophiala viscosa]|uniref:Uncharacterized protein n=1 Tax=Exophiala viscosa TaxID=2486360 RepID=A0AAN6E247_9EURO|nr:hypothetical protein EDD36DRAFT_193205 [Exophiala viscosa]